MAPTPNKLALHEELMLIALRDDQGTLEWQAGMHQFALGGAILSELALAGNISIEEGKKQFVNVVDSSPTGDSVLDEALQLMATAKRRKRAENWISRFASIRDLRHRVARQLCRRGILKEAEDKVLWIFTRRTYPEIDPRPEKKLVDQLRQAISNDDQNVKPKVAIVLSLAHVTGMLSIHFDKKELRRRKKRIDQIVSGDAVGGATKAAVQAAQAAMMATQTAAITAAVIASTTASSSY